MNTLVTAIADLVKTFCSGVVSLVTVPAQTLHASFGFVVYVLPFVSLVLFVVLRNFLPKKQSEPKLLNNNKKEDLK